MDPTDLLEALAGIAAEAGLSVRRVTGSPGDGEPPMASGVCRVRGELWVLLSEADPFEHRIEVLAQALRSHASRLLEERYLPPAVRERLQS